LEASFPAEFSPPTQDQSNNYSSVVRRRKENEGMLQYIFFLLFLLAFIYNAQELPEQSDHKQQK